MILFSAFILALAITVALIPPLMKGAVRLAIVDVPDERKVHTGAVPRVGGIAMVIGAIVPMLLWVPMDQTLSGLLTALAVLLLFGTWDDSRDLDYRLMFLGQLLAALVVVYVGGVKIAVFPFAGLDPVPDVLSIPITIVLCMRRMPVSGKEIPVCPRCPGRTGSPPAGSWWGDAGRRRGRP